MNCMARRGFLTLSDCGNPSATVCGSCARPVCAAHLSPASGFSTCLDCAARAPHEENKEKEDEATETDAAVDEFGPDYAYGYRHAYYADGYRPIYAGSSSRSDDTYYDDYDARSFDDGVNDQTFDDGDETEGTGFGDS